MVKTCTGGLEGNGGQDVYGVERAVAGEADHSSSPMEPDKEINVTLHHSDSISAQCGASQPSTHSSTAPALRRVHAAIACVCASQKSRSWRDSIHFIFWGSIGDHWVIVGLSSAPRFRRGALHFATELTATPLWNKPWFVIWLSARQPMPGSQEGQKRQAGRR